MSDKNDKKALAARLPHYDSKTQPQSSNKTGDTMDVKSIKFVMNTPFSAWDEREKAEFTVYTLKATLTREDTSTSVVEVSKRYSQFDELHEALEKKFKKVKLPDMPPKKWFGNTDPEFVHERSKKLEMYLNKVGADPVLVKAEELARFLQTTMVLKDSSGNASSPPTSPRADAQISSPTPVAKPAAAETSPQAKEAPPRMSAPGFSTPAAKPAAGTGGNTTSAPAAKAAASTVAAMGGGAQARALYDFAASSETELSLKTGDIVTLVSTQDSAWWYGQLANGKLGYFPSNYVSKI